MSEHDEAKQIQTTLNKTYAYFNAVLSSLLSANFLLFSYDFLNTLTDYLTYHGIDESGEKAHNIDLKTDIIIGIVSLAILLMLIISIKAWLKKIKALDQKRTAIVISLAIYIVLLPLFAYISLVVYSL